MELNERTESAQELPKINREQVGFLVISRTKFPLFIGRNKIGRDAETCNISLNFDCISKEHALINIINKKELMVMDLESTRHTRLLCTNLQPYIPYRIKDGDVIQFGDFFGVVNLFGEHDAQPIMKDNVPGIPVSSNHVSNINEAPCPLVRGLRTEPLDVSNKTGSSVTPSQRKRIRKPAKTSKSLPIEAAGPSTSSTSLSVVDNPSTSLYESSVPREIEHDSIVNFILDHTADHLPQVRKIDDQHEMQIDIYTATANKENNEDIFNAETQSLSIINDLIKNLNQNKSNVSNISGCSADGHNEQNLNTSGREDGECKKQETKAVPVEPKLLMIPEKASSFSIHSGQQCKEQCSYCKIKFRVFDKPCHIAQIKKPEILKKFLGNEKILTIDSCLCDMCYRYVLRRDNYPPRHKRPLIKHLPTLTRKFPKKRNIKVRRQLKNKTKEIQNNKINKKPGPKSKKRKSTAPDNIDGESSEMPNEIAFDDIVVIESSDDVPNDQSNSSEADRQTELQNELKQQNDPTQFAPNLGVKNKFNEVRKVKRSIQDLDSLHKTQDERTTIRKVDLEPDVPQNDSFCKDFEEDIVKINILKKIPLNEECSKESTGNKKPADIILLRSLVINTENEENRENIVKERITILKNINLNKECSIEIIPKKKLPDMNISKNKTQTSENTTQATSENIGHTKESDPVTSDYKEIGNRVMEDLKKSDQIVDNVSLEECSTDITPRVKHPDIILSKGKWLIKKDLREKLKNENRAKVKFVRGKRSIPMNSDNKDDRVKESIPTKSNVTLNEAVLKTTPNKTPLNINMSKNKGRVKKNPIEMSKNKKKLDSQDHVRLETNPSTSIRKILPDESKMNLQCNIEFDNVKEVTPQGWEKCNSVIQFDEKTKKVWNELQGPYGNRSSFLRHLVRLEKFFRQGDLILSPRIAPHGPV